MKFHFKESYMHSIAKDVLSDWIYSYPEKFFLSDVVRIDKEDKFYLDGDLLFVSDLSVYTIEGITTIFEIEHKHGIDSEKMAKMQYYCYVNNINISAFEIQAEYIMRQISCPDKIKMIRFL